MRHHIAFRESSIGAKPSAVPGAVWGDVRLGSVAGCEMWFDSPGIWWAVFHELWISPDYRTTEREPLRQSRGSSQSLQWCEAFSRSMADEMRPCDFIWRGDASDRTDSASHHVPTLQFPPAPANHQPPGTAKHQTPPAKMHGRASQAARSGGVRSRTNRPRKGTLARPTGSTDALLA